MSQSPFVPLFESLPQTLPIFPLPGAIVMPRAELPLNIFEPRYLNMVDDALGTHRMIGMIQPDSASADDNAVYHTGCAGRITQYRETQDGRIEMVLTGVCRFDLARELSTTRGYRLVVPDWSRFDADYQEPDEQPGERRAQLLMSLKRYFEIKGLEAEMSALDKLPTERLIDSLTMALPFSDFEKQGLLETVDAGQRLSGFIALIDGESGMPESVTRH